MLKALKRRTPILTYHAIAPDDFSVVPSEWSKEHIVSEFSFNAHLDFLDSEGWRTVGPESLGTILVGAEEKYVAITFDDGHASDIKAAETLLRHGFTAVFFLPWSHIGRRGYLDAHAVKYLVREGFKIGSHGMTHAPLTNRSEIEMERELVESKQRLEELTGTAIADLAVPFGRYDREVISAALAAGYERIMTSDMGMARVRSRAVLPRLSIHSRTTFEDFCTMLSEAPTKLMARRIRRGAHRRLRRIKSAVHLALSQSSQPR